MASYKIHHFKRDNVKVKRFNAIIPESYHKRIYTLSQDLEINAAEMLMRFMDRFDDIKKDNE